MWPAGTASGEAIFGVTPNWMYPEAPHPRRSRWTTFVPDPTCHRRPQASVSRASSRSDSQPASLKRVVSASFSAKGPSSCNGGAHPPGRFGTVASSALEQENAHVNLLCGGLSLGEWCTNASACCGIPTTDEIHSGHGGRR
jgi:hypothetical protein